MTALKVQTAISVSRIMVV